MKSIENECIGCDLPCIGNSCTYRNVIRFYCDECCNEDTLYHYNGKELCSECLLKEFEIVEGSGWAWM